MAVNVISLLPFVLIFWPKMEKIAPLFLILGLFLLEIYSDFSFGVASVALIGAWLVTRTLIRFFDAYSYISTFIVLFLGIFIYALIFTALEALLIHTFSFELLARGMLFLVRNVFVGILLVALLSCSAYSLHLIRDGFLAQEKI